MSWPYSVSEDSHSHSRRYCYLHFTSKETETWKLQGAHRKFTQLVNGSTLIDALISLILKHKSCLEEQMES